MLLLLSIARWPVIAQIHPHYSSLPSAQPYSTKPEINDLISYEKKILPTGQQTCDKFLNVSTGQQLGRDFVLAP